ncbi:helix-turn-helix transcriptional regulator [Insolitispirillum peregrinum]|uniref:helix-turn-helix transcriptional regulator n=1 Tax=Insolitispirillum peregrinum TaxID=80876 RepID=UPI003621F267
MRKQNNAIVRLILDATENFQLAADKDDLWARFNRTLEFFAITGSLYGAAAMPRSISSDMLILDSLPADYTQTKMDLDLFHTDLFVQAGLLGPSPVLWNDIPGSGNMSESEKRSLELDWDFQVTTGVTIPVRFAGGLGASAFGCHAAGMSWKEFDHLWLEVGDAITTIANAFDAALRRDHVGEIFSLNAEERECLVWLAAGLRPKRIADRLRLSGKQVEKRLDKAREKLNATTLPQAVANALIFGLIDP